MNPGINYFASGGDMVWSKKTPRGDEDAIALLESAFWTTSRKAVRDYEDGASFWNANVFLSLACFLRRKTISEEFDELLEKTEEELRENERNES